MNTLASILAGAQGNPYQGAGGGIAPLLQQALQMRQDAGAPFAQSGQDIPGLAGSSNPRLDPTQLVHGANPQIGSLAQLALPGIATGTY